MMNPLYNVCNSMRRSTGFVLMAAALSLGAISGCGSNNNNSRGSDGGLEAVDPNAGIYPSIQVIQPFLSGAVDPIKVQYWDQTYYWGPDSDGNDACFKGTVGIEVSPDLAQETLSGQVCPTSTDPVDGKTSLGQVAPCNPDATPGEPYEVASGAVQPAIAGCEQGGAPCTDILVPDITDEVTCESMVRMADPIAAGAAWFQNIDAPGTKGGEASHWWYGTRAGKSFDAEDGYGGTQIDYISDATNINIVATGGGSDDPGINNIYLCSDKDVVNPAENPDVCTLSSLFGSCDKGDLKECKINNIGLVDGAYNIYIRSATRGGGGDLGGGGVGVGDTGPPPELQVTCNGATALWEQYCYPKGTQGPLRADCSHYSFVITQGFPGNANWQPGPDVGMSYSTAKLQGTGTHYMGRAWDGGDDRKLDNGDPGPNCDYAGGTPCYCQPGACYSFGGGVGSGVDGGTCIKADPCPVGRWLSPDGMCTLWTTCPSGQHAVGGSPEDDVTCADGGGVGVGVGDTGPPPKLQVTCNGATALWEQYCYPEQLYFCTNNACIPSGGRTGGLPLATCKQNCG